MVLYENTRVPKPKNTVTIKEFFLHTPKKWLQKKNSSRQRSVEDKLVIESVLM
jgi:hypothetical protein